VSAPERGLIAADLRARRFFVPPYVGHSGWVGIHVTVPVDWDELEDLITESYRMTAPKRFSAQLAAPESG
jgi:hypothetical protein